jgi:hypothetical protein
MITRIRSIEGKCFVVRSLLVNSQEMAGSSRFQDFAVAVSTWSFERQFFRDGKFAVLWTRRLEVYLFRSRLRQ